jgi:hypothetical protein
MFGFNKKREPIIVHATPTDDGYEVVLFPVFRRKTKTLLCMYASTEHTEWEEIRTSNRRVKLEDKKTLVECFAKDDQRAKEPIYVDLDDLRFPEYYS